jgi:hypothetical protein
MKGAAGMVVLRAWLLAALACGLVSCASMDSRTMQYIGSPIYPPTDPATVQILRTTPTQPHDQLGEIRIDATTDPAPSIEAVEARLRKDAARLGADAVVVVYDRIQRVGSYVSGGYWYRTVYPVIGRRLIGVAIKYRLPQPPLPPPTMPQQPQPPPAPPPATPQQPQPQPPPPL